MIRPFYNEIVFDITVNNEDRSKTRYELWLNTTISCKPYFSLLCSCDNDLSKRVVMYKETNLSKAIEKFVDVSGCKIPYSKFLYIRGRYVQMMSEYYVIFKPTDNY